MLMLTFIFQPQIARPKITEEHSVPAQPWLRNSLINKECNLLSREIFSISYYHIQCQSNMKRICNQSLLCNSKFNCTLKKEQ